MSALAAVLAASLGRWASHASSLQRVLGDAAEARLEASVRLGADGRVRGGRMMVERVSRGAAEDALALLSVPLGEPARLWALASEAPLILGWDTGRAKPVAKLYLNLSDASTRTRERLAATLGVPGAPHVVGLNVTASGAEWKLYTQHDVPPHDLPPRLHEIAAGLPTAGYVRSFDVRAGSALRRRADFVALPALPLASLVERLDVTEAALASAVPFPAAGVRSIGTDPEGRAVTVYVQPEARRDRPVTLEPTVRLACPGGELGVFVVSRRASTERCYDATETFALSYRVRDGAPRRETIALAMRWVKERVAQADAALVGAAHSPTIDWRDPPRGIRVVID